MITVPSVDEFHAVFYHLKLEQVTFSSNVLKVKNVGSNQATPLLDECGELPKSKT